MKRVYIASRYERKEEMKTFRQILNAYGIEVTSRWLDEPAGLSPLGSYESAKIDHEDILKADTLVFFSEDPHQGWKRGGRHVEFGIALQAGKDIKVIGLIENTFHHGENIKHYNTFHEMLYKELKNGEQWK